VDTPHNLIHYVEPRGNFLPIDELWKIPAERCLAENAIWYFLNNDQFVDKDRAKLASEYKRRGSNIFIWKYYAAARCYLGGYKALSATLMLRKAL